MNKITSRTTAVNQTETIIIKTDVNFYGDPVISGAITVVKVKIINVYGKLAEIAGNCVFHFWFRRLQSCLITRKIV